MSYKYSPWKPYVSVAKRSSQAERAIKKQAKKGTPMQPVKITGRTIARSFWGKGWCSHLESLSDYENRLPRGRSYVRNGSLCHLEIATGRIDAKVVGSSMYTVTITIKPLKATAWKALKQRCTGSINSLLELLQGHLSEQVLLVVTDRKHGLFPLPGEMTFNCTCPDWANMCKHVAATLYGVGNRLDLQPELLFLLRGIAPSELIEADISAPRIRTKAGVDDLAEDQLGALFGIELEPATAGTPAPANTPRRKTRAVSLPVARKRVAAFRATGKGVSGLRKRLGLSMAEFATRLCVSQASVQRWESAGATPLRLQARCLAALTELHDEAAPGKVKR